jgi:hypothetical protein
MINLNKNQAREIKELLYIGYRSFLNKAFRTKCLKYYNLLGKKLHQLFLQHLGGENSKNIHSVGYSQNLKNKLKRS